LPPASKNIIADWRQEEMLSPAGKQQTRNLFPVTAAYPWEEAVFRYPHRFSAEKWGWIFLFLQLPKNQEEFRRQVEAARKEFSEAIPLISEGITHDIQQQDYYRQVTRKLISLSETRLPYYRQHSYRVARLLASFCRRLELAPKTTETLVNTAYFYDLGLLSIKTDILLKDSPLTEQEMYICQQHPLLSWEIARFSPTAIHPDKDAILYHHECFDGSGYPEQLSGSGIPLSARILSLVDSYTAMTETRPYRQALKPRQALKEISYLSGSKFDPVLTQEFCHLIKSELSQ
jgi:HD-GYP domain-containing protein (c-di-GMP phosphodiesterase class II)